MAGVRLISGGPRSDRAAQIDTFVLERLSESLLIVPTDAYAQRRAAKLLTLTGRAAQLVPPVITFGKLADRILHSSEQRARDVTSLERRIILARAATQSRQQGALESLGMAADSEGFLDHLLSIINELKQAAIEPRQFREHVRDRRNTMDKIVADVYTAYQKELKDAGMVDLPGKYWLARIECEKSTRPIGLGSIQQLVFDDFDDFTPSEFGVIKALVGHVGDIVFGINVNPDPEQRSLYATPLHTVAKIRAAFESAVFAEPWIEPAARRTSEFIGATLLVRKTIPVPAQLEKDVEFAEYHTLEHEIESIARRIKHLVRSEGAALPNIAVVWRNITTVAASMREIFREFGIPVSGLEARPLSESAAAGFILRFISATQTWSPESVLDVLTAPWFAGLNAPLIDTFPILVRAARVGASERSWRESIKRLADSLEDPKQIELKRLCEHLPHTRAQEGCKALVNAAERFGKLAKKMDGRMTIRGRIELLEKFIEQWHFAETVSAMPLGVEREFEESALLTLTNTFAILREGHKTDTEAIDLISFAKVLRRAFAAATAQVQASGGVSCLEMEPARYLDFDYVFLAGLTDTQIPAGRKLSAIYSEDDRRDLGDAGVTLDRAEAHNQGEILLFQRMFAIGRRRVFASWHRLSPGGSVVQRSLYLNEIADRMGGLKASKPQSPLDVLVPHPDLAACTRDAQNIMVPAGHATHFTEIAAAARMESKRYGFDPFDAHEGALSAPENLAQLAEHFNTAHEFSASQLETYAECPFQFFQERVLKLFAIETPEQAFDHLARGSVLHAALEAFHASYLGKTLGEIPEDEAAAAMATAAGEAFDDAARRLRNLSPGLLAAERARILTTLQRHLRLTREADNSSEEAWRPIHLEEAFGGESQLPPYALSIKEHDHPILLQGKIDRIDEGAAAFRLVDYKSSKVEAKSVSRGRVFQLALYALACEAAIIPGCTVAEAIYLGVGKDKGTTSAFRKIGKKPNWDERIAVARTAVEDAVKGIRAGNFHPTREGERCRGCPDEKVCRFERVRIQRKPVS